MCVCVGGDYPGLAFWFLSGHTHNAHVHSHMHTQFYLDRAVQRDVMNVLVKCDYHIIGCNWTGQLKNWEVREGLNRVKEVYVGGDT